jgi:hypothetical protein
LAGSYLGQLKCLNSEASTDPYIAASAFFALALEDELSYFQTPLEVGSLLKYR